MLAMGSSKPWQDAMEVMTGQRKMDASALMEYFDPLVQWLTAHNEGETPGWTDLCPDPETGMISDARVAEELVAIEDEQAMEVVRNRTVAAWNFNTNITDYNRQVMVS